MSIVNPLILEVACAKSRGWACPVHFSVKVILEVACTKIYSFSRCSCSGRKYFAWYIICIDWWETFVMCWCFLIEISFFCMSPILSLIFNVNSLIYHFNMRYLRLWINMKRENGVVQYVIDIKGAPIMQAKLTRSCMKHLEALKSNVSYIYKQNWHNCHMVVCHKYMIDWVAFVIYSLYDWLNCVCYIFSL